MSEMAHWQANSRKLHHLSDPVGWELIWVGRHIISSNWKVVVLPPWLYSNANNIWNISFRKVIGARLIIAAHEHMNNW